MIYFHLGRKLRFPAHLAVTYKPWLWHDQRQGKNNTAIFAVETSFLPPYIKTDLYEQWLIQAFAKEHKELSLHIFILCITSVGPLLLLLWNNSSIQMVSEWLTNVFPPIFIWRWKNKLSFLMYMFPLPTISSTHRDNTGHSFSVTFYRFSAKPVRETENVRNVMYYAFSSYVYYMHFCRNLDAAISIYCKRVVKLPSIYCTIAVARFPERRLLFAFPTKTFVSWDCKMSTRAKKCRNMQMNVLSVAPLWVTTQRRTRRHLYWPLHPVRSVKLTTCYTDAVCSSFVICHRITRFLMFLRRRMLMETFECSPQWEGYWRQSITAYSPASLDRVVLSRTWISHPIGSCLTADRLR